MEKPDDSPSDQQPSSEPQAAGDAAPVPDLKETTLAPANDNSVGYRRPPIHTRFKPGKSGNPRGRRKAAANVGVALRDALDEQVPVIVDGVRKKLSKARALIVALTNKALKGDTKALVSLVKLGVRIGSIKPVPQPRRGGVLIMKPRFWKLTQQEKQIEMVKEAARRDALLAAGLPYRKSCMPD